jgi:hypothetical protein
MNKSILVHSTNGNAFVIPIDNIGYIEGSSKCVTNLTFKDKIEICPGNFAFGLNVKESPEEINNLING